MTNLKKLYKEINNFEKSKIYVNEALKINPKYPEALNLLALWQKRKMI